MARGLEDTHAAALLEADGADENICYASGPTDFNLHCTMTLHILDSLCHLEPCMYSMDHISTSDMRCDMLCMAQAWVNE